MSALRHNKLASLLLALAVFFTAIGVPAVAAAACEHALGSPMAAAAASSSGMGCAKQGAQKQCCCCAPKSHAAGQQAERSGAAAQVHHGGVRSERCPCSISAPSSNPPADAKAPRLVLPAEVACLPAAPLQIHLPSPQPWTYAAPTAGPPNGPACPTAPARAPPACL